MRPADNITSIRSEMNRRFNETNSRFNTLYLLNIGAWATIIAAVLGLIDVVWLWRCGESSTGQVTER